jgi:Mn-dependent DtxR family transcriptional regulator
MYLEAIYVLAQERENVRAIDVGAYLGYSKPSVSRALGILRKEAYITLDASGYIKITKTGADIARKLYERHTVLSEMLISLGVDKVRATEDACRIEHVISDESFLAIRRHFEDKLHQ